MQERYNEVILAMRTIGVSTEQQCASAMKVWPHRRHKASGPGDGGRTSHRAARLATRIACVCLTSRIACVCSTSRTACVFDFRARPRHTCGGCYPSQAGPLCPARCVAASGQHPIHRDRRRLVQVCETCGFGAVQASVLSASVLSAAGLGVIEPKA